MADLKLPERVAAKVRAGHTPMSSSGEREHFAYGDPEPAETDTCRVYEDDEGNPIRLRGKEPLDDAGKAALKEIIAAAKRRFDAEPSCGHGF